MTALLAAFEPSGSAAGAFALISLGLLVIGYLLWLRGGNFETNLILLGILVCVAAVGYGGLVTGDIRFSADSTGAAGAVSLPASTVGLAGTLMRLGFILVLGGVACGILVRLQAVPPPSGPNL